MPITWNLVTQNNLLQQQDDSRLNPQDLSLEETATITFTAYTTDLTSQPGDAKTATDGTTSIPTLGAYYNIPAGNWFLCTHLFPKKVGPGTFEVQVEYYRKIAFKPDGDKWAAQVSFSGVKYTEKVHKDCFGNAILNSAGVSFDPGRNRVYQDERMDISYKTTTPPDLRPYRSQVNSVAIDMSIGGISRSYDPRQLLFDDGTMSSTVTLGDDANTPVWDVKLSFTSRTVGADGSEDGYVDRILDEGKEYRNPSGQMKGGGINDAGLSYSDLLSQLASAPAGSGSGDLIRASDGNGTFADSPQLLDGNGDLLSTGDDPVFLAFAVEGQTDLSPLFEGF